MASHFNLGLQGFAVDTAAKVLQGLEVEQVRDSSVAMYMIP